MACLVELLVECCVSIIQHLKITDEIRDYSTDGKLSEMPCDPSVVTDDRAVEHPRDLQSQLIESRDLEQDSNYLFTASCFKLLKNLM